MTEPITSFRGEYDFLSNFYPSPVEMDGAVYPTVEHAFQAAKTHDPDQRPAFQNAKTPSGAKQMGRKIKRRMDWFNVSLVIMESLVRQKFTKYTDLRSKLLSTSDAPLIEGNTWRDKFYGAIWDSKKSEWVGENHLGRILMKIRAELQDETT
jgi:ribA/ribD-fused uncharacterized protein